MSPGAAPSTGAVSLVVPAYNEGAILASVLSQLVESFPAAEILVVSDGSTDDTVDVARSFAPSVGVLEYRPNRGKGCAVRTGMLAASGTTLVFTDADLPFGVEGIARILDVLETQEEVDIAIVEKTGAYRGVLYRAARAAVRVGVRLSLGLEHADTQAGLKGFRRSVAQDIFSRAVVDGFAADMEILGIAARRGYRVAAVPLQVVNDSLRPSTFTVPHGLRLLRDVRDIRRRLPER